MDMRPGSHRLQNDFSTVPGFLLLVSSVPLVDLVSINFRDGAEVQRTQLKAAKAKSQINDAFLRYIVLLLCNGLNIPQMH